MGGGQTEEVAEELVRYGMDSVHRTCHEELVHFCFRSLEQQMLRGWKARRGMKRLLLCSKEMGAPRVTLGLDREGTGTLEPVWKRPPEGNWKSLLTFHQDVSRSISLFTCSQISYCFPYYVVLFSNQTEVQEKSKIAS